MNKDNKSKKLKFSKTTVKTLSTSELRKVAGGNPTNNPRSTTGREVCFCCYSYTCY